MQQPILPTTYTLPTPTSPSTYTYSASADTPSVESAVLSNHQIKAEPRLTAVVAWNPATAAAVFGKLLYLYA